MTFLKVMIFHHYLGVNMFKYTVLMFIGLLTFTAVYGGSGEPVTDHTKQKTNASSQVTVYRSPSCGCCEGWVEHIKKHGFDVKDLVVDNVHSIKVQMNVPKNLWSCHTAIIDGYAIEGHVPAADIKKLIQDKPKVAGLAVPQMPIGTPGMEMGNRKDPFNVIAFDSKGHTTIFNQYKDY